MLTFFRIDHELEKVELSLRLSDVDPKAAKEKMKSRSRKKRKRVSSDRGKDRAASYDSSLESR